MIKQRSRGSSFLKLPDETPEPNIRKILSKECVKQVLDLHHFMKDKFRLSQIL